MHLPGISKTVVIVFSILAFIACHNDKNSKSSNNPKITSSATTPADASNSVVTKAEDGPAVATLQTDKYTVKVHRAIPFVAKQDDMGMFKVKEGHQFIVLDMSVKNTSNEPIAMGEILLSTKVKDESGKDINLSITAVAAYTYTYPNPIHHQQYNAMWGTLKPGEFYRTIVYGMEAPKETRSFVLSMPVEPGFGNNIPRKETKFSF